MQFSLLLLAFVSAAPITLNPIPTIKSLGAKFQALSLLDKAGAVAGTAAVGTAAIAGTVYGVKKIKAHRASKKAAKQAALEATL